MDCGAFLSLSGQAWNVLDKNQKKRKFYFF